MYEWVSFKNRNMIRKICRAARHYCVLCTLLCAGLSGYAQSAADVVTDSAAPAEAATAAPVSASAASTEMTAVSAPVSAEASARSSAPDTPDTSGTAADAAGGSGDTASGTAANNLTDPLDIPVTVSAFKIIPQYYGLPLAVRFGWFYRKNDFSVFPHAGFSFSVPDTPTLDTSIGVTIQQKSFFWNVSAVYDLVPFTMHKKADEQAVYGLTSFGYAFPGIRVTLPLLAGRLRQNEVIGGDGSAATKSTVVTHLSAGLQLDFFLADLGFFKSTGAAAFHYHWVPKAAFHYYTFSAAVPASFQLYYVDIAFMYSLFHTSAVQYGTAAPLRRYALGKTQSGMTGRSAFKPQPLFKDMHLFSAEFRWYPARLTAQTNGFFLSLFADAGLGITAKRKRAFLYEAGGGLGYNLYDSVPLTFQVGFNQKLQPVFYLSFVSRLAHRP